MKQIISLLEDVGLTKAEVSVYLALLELGNSTTGPIVKKAKVASSKIYELLDKLIAKGLVSFVIISGKKNFTAASPERILDYVQEKENQAIAQRKQLQTLLPQLKLKQKKEKTAQATIFKGVKGAQTAFADVLKTMKKGEEYQVFGAMQPQGIFFNFIKHFHKERAKRGIRVKLLYTQQGEKWAEQIKHLPLTSYKFASPQLFSSSFILLYKHKTLLTVGDEKDLTFIRIEDKAVTNSFRAQFDSLWQQDTHITKGLDAVQAVFEEMLTAKTCDLIGARGYFMDRRKSYIKKWAKRAQQAGLKMRNIVDSGTKGHFITTLPFIHTKYNLSKEMAHFSVIWMFNDTVFISNWVEDEPIVLRINNKQFYDLYKQQFVLIWEKKSLK